MTRLVVIVPARSGSVGVPDKNIAAVQGVPLLVRAFRVGTSLPSAEVIVSTDSPAYLEVAAAAGYSRRSLRPAELSAPTSLVIDTVLHELECARAGDGDLCLLLEPSFVGRRKSNIQRALGLLQRAEADSCFGAYPVPLPFHFSKQYAMRGVLAHAVGREANVNRQALEPTFVRSGEFYLSRVSLIRQSRSLFSGRLSLLETLRPFVNIDTPEDMAVARSFKTEDLD